MGLDKTHARLSSGSIPIQGELRMVSPDFQRLGMCTRLFDGRVSMVSVNGRKAHNRFDLPAFDRGSSYPREDRARVVLQIASHIG